MATASPKSIRPEELAKRYAGRWMIGEDVDWNGTSQWVAIPCGPDDGRLTAHSVERLAEQLERAAAGS